MDINAIEAVLRDMRNQFVDEVPERCQRMETLAKTIAETGASGEAFDELYRYVHSLKGSGGTHGLPIITNICHHFENLLTDAVSQSRMSPALFAERMLSYIDLLATTAEALRRGVSVVDKEVELERLLHLREARQRVALLADSSKTMQGLFRSALDGFGLKVIVVDNGMQALMRLVHEPIDLLVVGNELDELSGQAVIAALRESHGRNHNIPVVLVKSANSALSDHVRASAVVTRDARMVEQLPSVLEAILQQMQEVQKMQESGTK